MKNDVVNDQIELMNMRCILQLRAMVRVNIRSVRTVSLSDLSPWCRRLAYAAAAPFLVSRPVLLVDYRS